MNFIIYVGIEMQNNNFSFIDRLYLTGVKNILSEKFRDVDKIIMDYCIPIQYNYTLLRTAHIFEVPIHVTLELNWNVDMILSTLYNCGVKKFYSNAIYIFKNMAVKIMLKKNHDLYDKFVVDHIYATTSFPISNLLDNNMYGLNAPRGWLNDKLIEYKNYNSSINFIKTTSYLLDTDVKTCKMLFINNSQIYLFMETTTELRNNYKKNNLYNFYTKSKTIDFTTSSVEEYFEHIVKGYKPPLDLINIGQRIAIVLEDTNLTSTFYKYNLCSKTGFGGIEYMKEIMETILEEDKPEIMRRIRTELEKIKLYRYLVELKFNGRK